MLVDWQFFSNFYLHWFYSNLSFFERDPHMDSPEGIRVKYNLRNMCLAIIAPVRQFICVT